MRAAVAVVPLLLVAACGHAPQGPSRKDFVARAEKVCGDANTQFGALAAPTSAPGVLTYVERLVQVADGATQRLEQLPAPHADAAAVRAKMMVPLRSQVTEGRAFTTQVRTAVQRRDQAALAKLVAHPPTPTKADLAWMRAYGFRQCVTMADTGER